MVNPETVRISRRKQREREKLIVEMEKKLGYSQIIQKTTNFWILGRLIVFAPPHPTTHHLINVSPAQIVGQS